MELSSAHLQIPCRVCETSHNPPHENTHWLFMLMLGPNITIVSGFLPHSSRDGHLGEFVYNVCFEWNFKIPRPQDVRLNCGLNFIFAFPPPPKEGLLTLQRWTVNRKQGKGMFLVLFQGSVFERLWKAHATLNDEGKLFRNGLWHSVVGSGELKH